MPQDPSEKMKTPLDEHAGAELSASIQAKTNEVGRISGEINPILDTLDEARRGAFMSAVDEVEAGLLTADDLVGRFAEGSAERQMSRAYKTAKTLMGDIVELEEQHKPYLIEEVTALAKDVSERLNWDAVLRYYDVDSSNPERQQDAWDNGIMSNAVASMAVLREVQVLASTGELEAQDYSRLSWFLHAIQDEVPEWEKRGFISDRFRSDRTETVEETKARRLQMKQALENGIDVISKYASLKNQFRGMFLIPNHQDRFLEQVASSLDLERGYGSYASKNYQKYDYDPAYLDAVERFVTERSFKLMADDIYPATGAVAEAHIEKLRAIPVESAVSAIRIEGFEEKEGETLVVTEADLRKELGLLVPACFLDKLELVIATERPEFLDKDEPNIETIGLHTPEFDSTGHLIKSKVEIYASPRVAETSTPFGRTYVEREFKGTALHEVGHRIHSDLDYSDMQRWIEVVEKDKTAVTQYVGHAREIGEPRGLREDFCESFQLAALEPGFLANKSLERFNYMMRLVGKYMGDEQREVFRQTMTAKLEKYNESMAKLREFVESRAKEGANIDEQ